MKQSVVETAIGALVLLLAVVFVAFSYKTANVGAVSGYDITADFTSVGGLKAGDTVAIGGVKVGSVSAINIVPSNYMARVTLTIGRDIKLPEDTAASISSQSLMGGNYVSLQPGGSEDMLASGGVIEFTQSPQNLEELLGKFIFSQNQAGKKDSSAAPETAPAAAPEDPAAEQPAMPETPADETGAGNAL